MLDEMIQRCPQCGMWVKTDRNGLGSRAMEELRCTVKNPITLLETIIMPNVVRAYKAYKVLTSDGFRFKCPNCEAEWSTDNEHEDQSKDYKSWLGEKVQIDKLIKEWLETKSGNVNISAEEAYDDLVKVSSFLHPYSSINNPKEYAFRDGLAKMTDVYSKHFNEIPAERRKYVTFVDDISICKEDVLPLRLCDIPSGFIFPGGKPITGVLYVANPVKHNIYYRAEDYELSTFRDQLDEFLLVLSSLGAKKLSFHDIRTSESTNDDKDSVGVSGKGNYLAYSGSAGVNVDRHSKAYQRLCNDYFREMEFAISQDKPSKPSTPWFKVMSDWQALAHQRLNLGTAIKDHRRIALSESATLQKETKVKVDAEFKLMKASLGIDVRDENASVFSENYDLCWEYDVEFYRLDEYDRLQPQTSQLVNLLTLNRNEQEYIAEYKASMEDGEISSGERRLLGRLAQKLGISPQRVKELEKQCSVPSFTDDEKEYLEEVKAVLSDGKVSEKERRLLKKLRNMHGISEQRAKEIERYARM